MDSVTVATEEQLFARIGAYLEPPDRQLARRAFDFARKKHGGQLRRSGEPFFVHPLTVAYYLAAYKLEAPALAAALLHDVAEDTSVKLAEIEARFGREVASIVYGVTKLKDVSKGVAEGREPTKQEIQDRSTKKLFVEMGNDMRVVIVKLFDRLHNMRTIKHMPPETQIRKARETLFVFAPMANRLGIWVLKSELEAMSLEILDKNGYEIIKANLKLLHEEQQEFYQLVSGQIMNLLLEANLDVRQVLNAPENIYTVYEDLTRRSAPLTRVDRTLRLVVLLNDVVSCYTALGPIHQLWRVVPNRFDDYISVPRDNLYRSLHTTVIHNSGHHVKIRLRTEGMETVSQIGVLTRWLYPHTSLWDQGVADKLEALIEKTREHATVDHEDAAVSVRSIVEDVYGEQIRVYTPRGDAIELARGATPIDFAYAIHTGLGDQTQSAYVNESLSPLNRPLRSGDRVRIQKSQKAGPQRDWLDEDLGYISTLYARSHAGRWFRRLSRKKAVEQGKQLLRTELEMLGQPDYPPQEIASYLGLNGPNELYYALGRAETLPTVVATRILDETWAEQPLRDLDDLVIDRTGARYMITHADGRPLHLCLSCDPRPRDNIVGYIRKNEDVTVHRVDCHSLRAHRTSGRLLKLGWGKATPRKARNMALRIDVYDRPGLLNDITRLMEEEGINISYICTPPSPRPGVVFIDLEIQVFRPRQAVKLLHQIRALVNVLSVRCLPRRQFDYVPKDGIAFYKPE